MSILGPDEQLLVDALVAADLVDEAFELQIHLGAWPPFVSSQQSAISSQEEKPSIFIDCHG
jgi:hypothetical protein